MGKVMTIKNPLIKLSIFTVFVLVVGLSGCDNRQGDMAKIVISFGNSGRANNYTTDKGALQQLELEHEIVLSNKRETVTFSHAGTGIFESYIAPGNWTIKVYSWLPDKKDVYAAGTVEANLQAGRDNILTIPMYQAHLVRFESNGGSEVSYQVVFNNEKADEPFSLKLDGCIFRGWYPNKDVWDVPLKSRYDFSKPVTESITLYAKWDSIWWSWDKEFSPDDEDPYESKTSVHITRSDNSSCDVTVIPVAGVNDKGHNWASQVLYGYTATAGKTYEATWKWKAKDQPFKNVTIRYTQDDYNDPDIVYDDSKYQQGTDTDTGRLTIPVVEETKTCKFTMPENCYMNFAFMVGADTGSFEIRDFKIEEVKIVDVPGTTLEDKLNWLKINENVVNGGNYTVTVKNGESIGSGYWFGCGSYNTYRVTITLIGGSVSLKDVKNRSMFGIDPNITLILENITLQGRSDNHSPLVSVNGKLIMNNGAVITGNSTDSGPCGVEVNEGGYLLLDGGTISNNTTTDNGCGGVNMYSGTMEMHSGNISGNTGDNGGGVWVDNGTFTMTGGMISGNKANWGSGVSVWEGTFTMSGGEISGNTAKQWGGGGVNVANRSGEGVVVDKGTFTMTGGKISGNTAANGGGVHVSDKGTFTMSGGEISGNKAEGTDKEGWYIGGGVHVSDGKFNMTGGTISDNTASRRGGGVHVDSNSTFTMSGGKISKNNITDPSTDSYGGGVRVDSATFTMSGSGEISGNNADDGGGALDVVEGTFNMNGGTISGNTAGQQGGGVYVSNSGTITKSGGTIYGYTAGNTNSNKAANSTGTIISNQGHAVYVDGISVKRRETTAGPGDKLDSTKAGAAGGWYSADD
jgi:hypothetical protein